MCSKSAYEIRKTRRNWNTGATAGSEDMPGKSLTERQRPRDQRNTLAYDFVHLFNVMPEKLRQTGAVQNQTAKHNLN